MAHLPHQKTHRAVTRLRPGFESPKTSRRWLNKNPEWRKKIETVAKNALAPNTQASYQSAWNVFVKFCDKHDIDKSLRFPADELVLCAFAASHAGLKAGGTATNRINSLKTWHAIHNVPWHGSARLSYVLRGVASMEPTSVTRPPRPPISAEMLRQLHDKLDLDIPLHAAVFAAATVAFWGQCRLGELLASSALKTQNASLPALSSLERHSKANGIEIKCIYYGV
ncbi:hypothetical protein RhiJN_21583 [Ceratobasidium sp. AG-Ba]|nr:hypothetical protein RhiJN_21583 [Ceratobasidium sp. AG-Ba]